MTQLYDYLDNELRLGDEVLFATPYRGGDLYIGRIEVITDKTVVMSVKFKRQDIITNKWEYVPARWKRLISVDQAKYQIFKLNRE